MFHDHALASEIRKAEQRFRLGHIHNLAESIARLIEERYEFSPKNFGDAQTAPPARRDDISGGSGNRQDCLIASF